MNSIKLFFIFSIIISCHVKVTAQIPKERLSDWSNTGCLKASKISEIKSINILEAGGKNDGITDNSAVVKKIINEHLLNGVEIYFPKGKYFFSSNIVLANKIRLKGESPVNTQFIFDLKGVGDAIIGKGMESGAFVSILQDVKRGEKSLTVSDAKGLMAGDWIELRCQNNPYMESVWAKKSLGFITQIEQIKGNVITMKDAARLDFMLTLQPQLQKIRPLQEISLENLKITRKDASTEQTSHIEWNYVVNATISNLEMEQANFCFIALGKCANVSISSSYFHDAFNYGDGGKGYGVCLQFASSNCLVENNIFKNLRHSMLLQSGANGNVVAYNYSIEPQWTGTWLPKNAAGDLVLHGNYPYANLLEGNIVQNIVIDDSHGSNGPWNTFFRNRAENYGIFMNAGAGDNMNFICNEITAEGFLTGQYILTGNGHYEAFNQDNKVIKPTNSSAMKENSLYLKSKPSFWETQLYPCCGSVTTYKIGHNPAYDRYLFKRIFSPVVQTSTAINNDTIATQPTATNNAGNIVFTYKVYKKNCYKCAGGYSYSIAVKAPGSSKDWDYSINNGISWQSSSYFKNLKIGTYEVMIKDELGIKTGKQVVKVE